MDKPNCKICGKKHWSHEDHVWPKDDQKVEWEKSEIPIPPGGVIQKHPNPEKKFDRVAYQREYMRKRRAKKS